MVAARAYVARVADPEQAEAHARATLRDCRRALEELVERLRRHGFDAKVPVLAEPAGPADIERAAAALGVRPPRVVELFWEIVGGFDPVAYPAYAHLDFVYEHISEGSGCYTDVLLVDGLSDTFIAQASRELGWQRDRGEERLLLPLAPDHYHKDEVSGGGPCGVFVGDDDWRPRFGGDFEWVGPRCPSLANAEPNFIEYLRASILECGGFPGLLGHQEFERLRCELIADLPVF